VELEQEPATRNPRTLDPNPHATPCNSGQGREQKILCLFCNELFDSNVTVTLGEIYLYKAKRDGSWHHSRGDSLGKRSKEIKVHPEPIRQTVRTFDNLPKRVSNKPSVKAPADGRQAAMESGPFTWRSALSEPIRLTDQAPSYRRYASI
jgi:hypothetical protein